MWLLSLFWLLSGVGSEDVAPGGRREADCAIVHSGRSARSYEARWGAMFGEFENGMWSEVVFGI